MKKIYREDLPKRILNSDLGKRLQSASRQRAATRAEVNVVYVRLLYEASKCMKDSVLCRCKREEAKVEEEKEDQEGRRC